MQNIPPLKLLLTFEAAARLQSFKAAANELCVTPSAVSQQIKTLEGFLNTPLFQRSSRQVTLTEAGRGYYEIADDALTRFKIGHERWVASQTSPTVRLSTTAQIAFDILIPALPGFQAQHPDIDLRFETTDKLANFDSEAVDAAIRIGDGDWSGLSSHKLCDLRVTAVATPEFLIKQPMTDARSWHNVTLIHARRDIDDWQAAGALLGLDFSNNKQLYFENYHAALSATENGMGVALALLPLTQSRLQRGQLQQIGPKAIPISKSCYLVHSATIEAGSALEKVAAWLQIEFANLQP